MLRLHDFIWLSLFYTGMLVLSFFVPVWNWLTIPAGALFTWLLIYHRKLDRKKKINTIHKRLSNLRSEGLIVEENIKGSHDDVFYRMILTLLTDLERSLFKLVEKNIQLLSLKEIGRSIISSLDEKKLVDSVFEYLTQGIGYKEAAFIILRKKKKCFQVIISIEKSTRVIRRVINFDLADLDGALYSSFISGKAFLIKDVKMHKLPRIGGEEFFPGSTMSSYICVPLMKSTDGKKCYKTEDCPLRQGRDERSSENNNLYLSSSECLSCPEIPLLGALIVTDGYRAAPLTNIDQVTLETVGSLVGSNIENWFLYQELRQEEIFREKVFEGMMHGLMVADLQGNITFTNRSAREMCQIEENELLGMKIGELIFSEPGKSVSAPILRVLNDNNPISFQSAYLKRLDGIHIPIRMSVSRLIGEDKKIQGPIVLFADRSDIKRMEEEIRHLDRLAVLGRFTSAIAHEIRNPLTGIAAGIQYLNRSEKLTLEQRESISFILNEVDRLNRIITDLFKVAKPRDLLYQQVELRTIIDRSFKSVSEIFSNKKIDFTSDIEDNLSLVEVDPDQVTQVMINLLKNSAEAVDDKGKVEVEVRNYRGEDPDIIREKEKDLISIEIRDNGRGIDEKDMKNIFEPFFSKKKGGTGLGLFVTHSIVQHHQGKITAWSEPHSGTRFKVYLPVNKPVKGGKIEASSTSGG
ncbi:MAG: PAS domain S-box protein [Candidatus Krumholzibacteriota bacterium]|nr:PAS domain S-box protein [Candidatus Krumholzibacteriota bacterium]